MLGGLRLARYRFSLICTSEVRLSTFPGAVLRSALGSALHDEDRRAYDYLYETSPLPESNASARDVPRPYVLAPRRPHKRRFHPGEELAFDLTLVGGAARFLRPVVKSVLALEAPERGEGDDAGLGSGREEGRGRFYLSRVMALAPAGEDGEAARYVVYDRATGDFYDAAAPVTREHVMRRAEALPADRLTVRFRTPTRLARCDGAPGALRFHQLHKTLSWRLRALLRRHCDRPAADFRAWVAPSYEVETVSATLDEATRTRYSASQEDTYTVEGLRGAATFAGDLAPFRPFLAAGEWLHVGKGYVMGLGRYRVEPAARSPRLA